MEQANYTNKYLQIFGDKLIFPKSELLKLGNSSSVQVFTSKKLEKTLFKPFKTKVKRPRKFSKKREPKLIMIKIAMIY